MKPFDEKFADNVRDAFDSFQTEVPEEEWQKMQKKLKASRKSRIIPLYPTKIWAAAAVVLVILGTAAFFLETRHAMLTRQQVTGAVSKQDGYDTILQHPSSQDQTPNSSDNAVGGKQDADNPGDTTPDDIPGNVKNNEDNNDWGDVAEKAKKGSSSPSGIDRPADNVMTDNAVIVMNDTVDGVAFNPAEMIAESKNESGSPESSINTPLLSMHLPYFQQQENTVEIKKKEPKDLFSDYQPAMERRKSPGWQVAAASMRPFATRHPGNGFGFSAGMINEWKISESISLQTGGLLAYNQLSYDPMSNRSFEGARDEVYLDSSFENNDTEGYLYNTEAQNDYEILAVDIPVNVKISIQDNRRKQWYISAGLSSLLFLQQNFTENQTWFTSSTEFNTSSGMNEQVRYTYNDSTEEEMEPFETFNFARLANLSVGYTIKRENDFLIIEPFVKLPLGGITHRQLSMGMGGITLKYGFGKK